MPREPEPKPEIDEVLEAAKDGGWRATTANNAAYERGELDDAGWHAAMTERIVPMYLAAPTLQAGSGHSGSADDWEWSRGVVADAIGDRRGTFLDIGCANGLMMESVARWRGVEPYGLDISPELAAAARARLPQWADRIFVGNALGWEPSLRFAIVRTGLEYVPPPRRRELVQWLLEHVVVPGGRLIIGKYNEDVEHHTIETALESWGFTVAGRVERAHRKEPRICYRAVWIAAAAMATLAACSAPPVHQPTSAGSAPSWFVGAWKREWLRERDQPAVEKRIVRDLQTPTAFGSVRIPIDRPAFAGAKSFADLDDQQLTALLEQKGFTGTASFEGVIATWHHEIDFQPPSEPDVGRLENAGGSRVLEHAMDESFVELWWSMGSGDGKLLAIRVKRGGRLERALTVVGDHFVYARNRAKDLPPADSLAELVAKTHATREQIVEYLDCEHSYGLVRGGRVPWEIRHSTLPWREGAALDFATTIAVDEAGKLAPREAAGETWSYPVNTMAPDDLRVLFAK